MESEIWQRILCRRRVWWTTTYAVGFAQSIEHSHYSLISDGMQCSLSAKHSAALIPLDSLYSIYAVIWHGGHQCFQVREGRGIVPLMDSDLRVHDGLRAFFNRRM